MAYLLLVGGGFAGVAVVVSVRAPAAAEPATLRRQTVRNRLPLLETTPESTGPTPPYLRPFTLISGLEKTPLSQ